ncbi:hypothetical protein [cyanobacterium endosymbiont of Rhopalodia gibberula]|uniref:hypothetical protein n=1 Tax=cyanobacterium endosymbiont of Rhopalodia gibberula TaxID=1763363 RepID=UPI000E64637E|nr:hypothetical protein [cyanobacterium endosymbiont of Rhopalodia gibberula]
MNYPIAVVSGRIKAEETYTAIEKASISFDQIALLGKVDKTVNGFISLIPVEKSKNKQFMMAYWLIYLGFLGRSLFALITEVDVFV